MQRIDSLSWTIIGIFCATLGLAPFVPEPHVWEKLRMLAAGELVRPLDIFDLLFHGLPWALAALKGLRELHLRQ
ncbi:RND transporter [Thalassovita sp.]|uniref:RND transporter n=1 Tax=Thalassovita sp. TaxID=1979401 RepID=UPI0029DE569F|nr:RND transporter [Thalassovita sp.]